MYTQFDYFDNHFFGGAFPVTARLLLYKENPHRSFVVGKVREVQCSMVHIQNFEAVLRTYGGKLEKLEDNDNFALFNVHDNVSHVGELVIYK